jgi:hypothetical protein
MHQPELIGAASTGRTPPNPRASEAIQAVAWRRHAELSANRALMWAASHAERHRRDTLCKERSRFERAAPAFQDKDYVMTSYLITAPRQVPETYRSALQSIVLLLLATIGPAMNAFSEMQDVRRRAEQLHRFAEDW